MPSKKKPREPFDLPESEAPRLTRTEMISMEMFMVSLSDLRYVKEDLKDRLKLIPSGLGRMNMVLGQLSSLMRDVCGSIPDRQRRHLRNISKDLEARLVPKLTPNPTTLLLSEGDAKELIDSAQTRCIDCVQEEEESRSCPLRRLLEVAVPLEHYRSYSCPYSIAKWEDEE